METMHSVFCLKAKRDSSKEEEEEEGVEQQKGEFQYDVFLSFRQSDTDKSFTDQLYSDLVNRGLRTFKGIDDLGTGEDIRERLGCIEKSEILVPIFSIGYADSKWCLMELAKMVECGRLILPIFIDVEPSHVQNQSGPLEVSFERYKESKEECTQQWRDALRKAAEKSGYELKAENNGDGTKLRRIIIDKILQELSRTVLVVAQHPVGIDDRVEPVLQLLDIGCDDVRMVGIHGIGGIGKTSLAKAIFNRISSSFKISCLLLNVREECKQVGGIVSLQKRIVSEASKIDNPPQISDENQGRASIVELLSNKATLLVIDDVDDFTQLNALAGGEHWFGSKSRIIVTTRFGHILSNQNQAARWSWQEIYSVEELNDEESLQLFMNHAFADKSPIDEEFVELSREVAASTHGIPMILKAFASVFFDKSSSPSEWKEILEELKQYQHKVVHDRLKISLDGLNLEEHQIFLDIACFIIGEDKEEAFYFWSACNLSPHTSVQTLLDRSLITINGDNRFEMHEEIRKMGLEMIRQEAPHDPGKRSRVLRDDDVCALTHTDKGFENVLGISLDIEEKYLEPSNVETLEGLATFPNLILLQTYGPYLDNNDAEGFLQLPSSLKWLQQKGTSFIDYQSFPNLIDLVVFSVEFATFDELPTPNKSLDKLKVLQLSRCDRLISTPDFSYMPNLVKVELKRCISLNKVDESVGCLKHLILLDLSGCGSLAEIPATVGNLISLRELVLEVMSIRSLPDSVTQLSSLLRLSLDYCSGLVKLPEAIGRLTKLSSLNLVGCVSLRYLPDSIGQLQSLETLNLYGNHIKRLPDSIGGLKRLTQLDLQFSWYLEELPDSIGDLESLGTLNLKSCQKLKSLPDSIGRLKRLSHLNISYSPLLQKVPSSIGCLKKLAVLSLSGCDLLQEIPHSICELESLEILELSGVKCLRDSIGCLDRLLTLNLSSSLLLEKIPDSIGNLKNLRCLNLDHCSSLLEIPDSIGELESLEELNLRFCNKIQKVPDSIGRLEKLSTLDLSSEKLDKVPDTIRHLKSLRKLYLVSPLEEIPDSFGELESLEILVINYINKIKRVPDCIGRLERLSELNLAGSSLLEEISDGIGRLRMLETLNLSACDLLEEVPESLGDLECLRTLFFGGNKLRRLPSSLSGLYQLTQLRIWKCGRIQWIPELPSSLVEFKVDGCPELRAVFDVKNLTQLEVLEVTSCAALVDVPGIEHLKSLRSLVLRDVGRFHHHHSLMNKLSKATYDDLCHLELAWDAADRGNNIDGDDHLVLGYPISHLRRLGRSLEYEFLRSMDDRLDVAEGLNDGSVDSSVRESEDDGDGNEECAPWRILRIEVMVEGSDAGDVSEMQPFHWDGNKCWGLLDDELTRNGGKLFKLYSVARFHLREGMWE